MSSSSVFQGLQSCLEPHVIQSRVLKLKLALPGSNFSASPEIPTTNTEANTVFPCSASESQLQHNSLSADEYDTKANVDGGCGWGFLQAIPNSSLCNDKTEDQVYVHPTVKRSSSMLSEKSLEMCTESLGSETGSNAGESGEDVSLFSFDTSISSIRENNNTHCESKTVNRGFNFPPPLTSITDLGGVHVRPRREGGRLILEAFAAPSPRRYFHAERSDGRLRLCLLENVSPFDDDDEKTVEEDEEVVVEEEETETNKNKKEKEDTEEEGEEECVENVEDEMGMKKLERPRRCKESGNMDILGDGLANLSSFPFFLSVSEV